MPTRKSKAARPGLKRPRSDLRRQLLDVSAVLDVSAALIFHKGKLLITRRKDDAHLGGLWEFPGGKREAGETFKHCLAREIHEELGMEIAVGKLFEDITHHYEAKSVRLKFFLCACLRGKPQAIGCAGFKWILKNELANYSFPAADARLLKKLIRARTIWT